MYERVPHITLKSIANNAAIDAIWEQFQAKLEPLRAALNGATGESWEEWQIPRDPDPEWSDDAASAHENWWTLRIARQKEIDADIAARADSEYLYDKPYEDKRKVRVAGPFTVESLEPHRMLGVDEHGEVLDPLDQPSPPAPRADPSSSESGSSGRESRAGEFSKVVFDYLQTHGVQQAEKADRIAFETLDFWPGESLFAEGSYREGGEESQPTRRAALMLGPEFGTVTKQNLLDAAREAADARFDVLIALAFAYDAHAAEAKSLGRMPVLRARMNADLHMAEDLKNAAGGNPFVIFGEPDVKLLAHADDPDGTPEGTVRVEVAGVDIYDPATGKVRSDDVDGIACWFVDTDYDGSSFFVRHAYFLGADDPYDGLRKTLRAEIDREAWDSLHGAVSRPIPIPGGGRIAVKVVNHLGDEALRVLRAG